MTKTHIMEILRSGQLELRGQFTWGSNSTFLVDVASGAEHLEAVYKPRRGERPLWDFPDESLAGREVAAFLVSESLDWDLVPPTILRVDGPFGPGSLQVRVDHDPERHYFNFTAEERQGLRRVAVFDLLVNNADRKGGHILLDAAGKLWLIDHGISFHEESKLRTVIWDFIGEDIPAEIIDDLKALAPQLAASGGLRAQLEDYLTPTELTALEARCQALVANAVFPAPPEGERAVPWPLV